MEPQRKTRRTTPRRDLDFHESLAPTIPLAPSADVTRRLPVGYILAALWVIVAIALGVAAGLMIVRSNQGVTTMAPFPVAQMSLKVVQPQPAAIRPAAPAAQPGLTVKPSASVEQATAGNPLKVASTSFMQPAGAAASLQPGYTPYSQSIQGEVGTAPVVTP